MANEKIKTVLDILPHNIKEGINNLSGNIKETIEEIRIREGVPVLLYMRNKEMYLYNKDGSYVIPDSSDIFYIINNITKKSMYAYLNDIKNGFITIDGGHRVGICGTAVCEENKIINIKDIKCLNIRIAREIKGVSDKIIDRIYSFGEIKNTIIVSPPKAGKTTLLRDITRNLSKHKMMKIALIDERDEIAAVYMGKPMNDVGERTFILSGYSKQDGFAHALRSLSPNVIICDELVTKEDVETVKNAINRGVKIITTIHGYSAEDIQKKDEYKNLLSYFETVITLDFNGFISVDGEINEC